jgi:hypothetical protein
MHALIRIYGFCLLGAAWLLGCGTPSVGVGYGIPGTPVSVGASVPLGKGGAGPKKVVWRPLRVESAPDGAEIYINDQLVGTTPLDIQVPFEKGTFGGARGSAQLLLKKRGYLSEGTRLFPTDGGHVSREPEDGPALGTLKFRLRAEDAN